MNATKHGQPDLDGVIVVDKPSNITSAGVVSLIKKAFNAGKVGHAGTLDPFAEGVLICCVNRATRLAGFLMQGPKKYVAVLKLGQETDTQDLTGRVIATAEAIDCSPQTIQSVVNTFKGPLEQIPPVYSALKHKGVPLYELARRGQPIQKPSRRVNIYDIRVEDIELPYVRFAVSCSAGTYIRTLGAEIGKKLGCGGHLNALKRIQSSGFALEQAIPLSTLEELSHGRKLLPKLIRMNDALPGMREYCADDRLAEKIRHGQKLMRSDMIGFRDIESVPNADDYLKIVDRDEELVAIVQQNTTRDTFKYCCVFQK